MGTQNLTFSGKTSEIGGLAIQANNAASPITLTGANSQTGSSWTPLHEPGSTLARLLRRCR